MSHDHHHMMQDFKHRFFICLTLSIPILILSPMIQSFFNFSLNVTGAIYISLVLSSIIYVYGGYPFIKGFVNEIRRVRPGMMTLIALAISVAYVYSLSVVIGLVVGKIFFWELATLIDIMLLGHWIEMKSVMGASMALEKLATLMPDQAHLVSEGGSTKDVSIKDLKEGDNVLVKPGEKIPADGIIVDGSSEINEAALTGESKPASKSKDDKVIGGAINISGALTVQVQKAGKDSYISQVIGMVENAMESKSNVQSIADITAAWLTLIAIIAGAMTFIIWILMDQTLAFSLERTVTVMVITCPHALGLAVPLVIAVITGLAAAKGLIIRNRVAFEEAENLNVIVFDKTGTLTKGEFGVSDIVTFEGEENELLAKAAAVEQQSKHSIASSIVKYVQDKGIDIPQIQSGEAIAGKGASGVLGSVEIFAGNKKLLESLGIKINDEHQKALDDILNQGKTVVFVASKDSVLGLIGLSDLIRDESREACKSLKELGFDVAMITGDNSATASAVGKELGIDIIMADVLPDEKAKEIKKLQDNGKKVAMVGDGINDAPALVQADIGLAISAGTDVAIESADVILVQNDPRDVVDVIKFSKATRRKMIQNLFWAAGYNVVAIPLAAGVLYNQGIVLPPAVGALIMSISTVVVAINSKLIKP